MASSSNDTTSTNPKKRKMTDFFGMARKKRKVQYTVPESKFEDGSLDNHQYHRIFHAVTESDLVLDQSIPRCIVQEIAESATGSVMDCGNPKCDGKVVTLSSDEPSAWDFDHYFWEDSRIDQSTAYFCSLCAEWAFYCEGYERRVFIEEDKRLKCDGCNIAIYVHECCVESCSLGWECRECQVMLCRHCVGWCSLCGYPYCGGCFGSNDTVCTKCNETSTVDLRLV